MMSKPLLLLVAAALLLPAAHAQTAPPTPSVSASESDSPFTLADALRLAATRNPQLRGARAAADASEGAFVQAGMRPNPEVSYLQESFQRQENTRTAMLNQRIELGGKRGYRMDVAAYGREASLAAVDAQSASVRANVTSAYFGLLAAQKTLEVSTESAGIAQRSTDLVARRVSAGKVSPVEETKARVALAAAQIELTRAATSVAAAEEKLANTLGGPWPGRVASDAAFDALPAMPSLAQLRTRLDDAPSTRQALANLRQSNARIGLERARRIPDVTISAGYKRVTTGGLGDNQAVVGVSIPLPIFDTNRGAIMEATHNAAKAEADLASEQLEQRLALTQAYAGYENATQEARRLKRDVLPAARDALDAMSRGYALGKFQFLDVLDAQRTLFDAQTRYIRALTDAHLAYAELDRLVGTSLDVAAAAQPAQP
jgi:outer membrane protein, heavy metal efflux system